MPKFTVVASRKDGDTVEQTSSSAAEALDHVHEFRDGDCKIVTIYRDGAFCAEDDLVTEAAIEAKNKHAS